MTRNRDLDLAWFCLLTGVQPSEYWLLTLEQQEAFLDVLDQIRTKIKEGG